MANIPMNGPDADSEASVDLSKLTNLAGALVSLGLIVGAVMWGHSLLSRDVSGVPVVKAIDGPMREQPLDPGGLRAAHQGLSVNNVTSEGTAQAPGDRLVLAPNSVDLRGEDSTLSEEALARAVEVAPRPQVEPTIKLPKPIELDGFERNATVGIVEKRPLVSDPALYGPKRREIGLTKSLRPKIRPTTASNPTAIASGPVAPSIDDGSSLAAGTRLVQLGAFASSEIAQEQWGKLQTKFPAFLGNKSPIVQRAESGGKTFYRLRAVGFADLSDARRLCAALKAQNADCIPVVSR